MFVRGAFASSNHDFSKRTDANDLTERIKSMDICGRGKDLVLIEGLHGNDATATFGLETTH